MTPHQPGDWHHIAQQLTKEMDSEKVLQLAEQLNRMLGEREEVRRKRLHHEIELGPFITYASKNR